jgi:hypothetical protein
LALWLALVFGIAGCQADGGDGADGGVDTAQTDLVFDADILDAIPDAPPMPDVLVPPPPALMLTVNELPRSLNGSEPYSWQDAQDVPFRVAASSEHMTLDLMLEAGSGPVDWGQTLLECDGVSYGADLLEVRDSDHARIRFTPEAPHPLGNSVGCGATVTGPGGSASSALTFDVATLAPVLDPFVTPDLWLVILERDIFQLAVSAQGDGTYAVESAYVAGGNGVSDLQEALEAIGLMSTTNGAAAHEARRALLDRVRAETRAAFGLDTSGQMDEESVPIVLFFEGDAGAPHFTDYDGKSFSMIAVGGDGTPAEQETGLVGRALLDPNNQDQENNTTYGLGVYPSAIVRQVLAEPVGVLALSPILPGVGTPLGDHALDGAAMDPDYAPVPSDDPILVERHALYTLLLDLFGRAIAATLAHEIGHSLGLVPPGPPPRGLFAEMPGLSLTVHDIPDWHIDTPGLNIMQTGAVTNWVEAIGQTMRFNPLCLAYLRRRLVVDPLAP